MLSLDSLFSRDEAVVFGAVRDACEHLYLSPTGAVHVLRNMLWVTVATLLPCLALFLLRRPSALQSGMWAQVALHGMPVVLLVNLAMAHFYGVFLTRLLSGSQWRHLLWLLSDALARVLLTVLLTALSFLLWAKLKGAFAGSASSALGAVTSSFRYGIRFESLTGVYLYSVGLGALPVFALGFLPILARNTVCRALTAALASLLQALHRPAVATLLWFCLASAAILAALHGLLGAVERPG